MARIAFITLYDEFAHGTRILVANLKKHGHFACMICFKSYSQEPLSNVKELYDGMHIQVLPGTGDNINAYSYPPLQKEDQILLDLLRRLKPDLVGIPLTCVQKMAARRLTALIRKELGVPIMWGGAHPTTAPDECIQYADYVCRGEAEEALLDVARQINAGEPFTDIKNIWMRLPSGEVIKNVERPMTDDLDSLPFPDYSKESIFFIDDGELRCGVPFPESDLNRNYLVMTTRGCPYACTYCYQSYLKTLYKGKKFVRERSLNNVLEELRQAKKRMGHFYLEILDNIFTLKESRVEEFCRRYHEEIDEPFWCYTHPRCCKENVIRHLAASPNFEYMIMGIESVSNHIGIDVFHRKQTPDEIVEAAKILNKYNINVNYDFITNVPGETEEDCRQNLDLLRRFPKPFRIRLSKLSLFPNYEVQKETEGQKRVVTEKRYRIWNALYFLVQEIDFTDEQLEAILYSPFFEEHPEFLENLNKVFDCQWNETFELRVQNKLKNAELEVRREREYNLNGNLARLMGQKGMKQFLWLHESASRAKKRLKGIF